MSSHSWAKHRVLLRASKNDAYYRVSQWITYPHLVEMCRRVWSRVSNTEGDVGRLRVGRFVRATGQQEIDDFQFQRSEA